ncbi:MAG: 6-phosphofructokinase [Chromatiaceae bacterium]|nr:6-phosphofructokinase [Chromatiaceae bacterium]
MSIKCVALLTAGGLAPCLSSAIGRLIERYTEVSPETKIICYLGGYKGLLKGESITVSQDIRNKASILYKHGGSPIGNSRVKFTNVKDCEKRGLVKPGGDPLEVAAKQLVKDGVEVLHTIGGDDTNTTPCADSKPPFRKTKMFQCRYSENRTGTNDVPEQQSSAHKERNFSPMLWPSTMPTREC